MGRSPLLLALTCLGLLLAQPGGVRALRCWVCSSSTDVRCRDPFNRTHLVDVDCDRARAVAGFSDRAYCQKTITSIHGGEQKVLRKCVFSREPLAAGECFDQPQSTDFLTVEHCSTCDTDGCNAAPEPAAASTTALALALSVAAARLLR